MKKSILFSGFSILLFCAIGCIKEDYFELSSRAEILDIQVSSQNGNTGIFSENDSVFIEVANGVDLSEISISALELSSFATTTIEIGDVMDFSGGFQNITVTAEDGTQKNWKIAVYEVGSEPQVENSDFNQWYNAGTYLDIGLDDPSSSWGTSNPGAIFGGLDANVERLDLGDGNYAAKMTTLFTFIGAVVNKPIAAGSLFTGDFDQENISISDPEASLNLGIPFTAMPVSFNIEYNYQPGEENINAQQEPLSYGDFADLYALLERRDGDQIKRVATAWLRTDQTSEGQDLTEITIDFHYGVLPVGTPNYMLPGEGETYADEDETPTHLVVVFSSSGNGALFEGAVGSTLTVDNFALNYE